ncbi:MAG: glycosyl transferase family 1, partial [Oscillochloris sp.]|nr:glycosyl transferase family 1 [Oscillochloris sp.]
MRIAIVTPYPPSTGSLNEYAFHFVRFLRQKLEVDEVIILTDVLPDGEAYPIANDPQPGVAALRIIPCWSFGAIDNNLRILHTVRSLNVDVVIFNIQFATFGRSKPSAALGLLTPAMIRAAGIPVMVLLHNIMETVDLKSAGFGANPLVEYIIRSIGTITTRLLLRADVLSVTIPRYVEILEAKYGATNVVLAPHGAFDEASPPTFDPPPGPLQIMTFGKFGTYKRVESLIDAFRLLQNGHRNLELVIAGTDSPNASGYLDSVRRACGDLRDR